MGRSPEPYLRRRFRPWMVGHWEMWQLRAPVVVAVLLVCGSAAVLVGTQFLTLRPAAGDVLLTGALVLLGLVHTEIASKVERMRRRVSDASYYDLSSVWTFSAALLLPPPLAATVVVAVYLHLWVRVWRPAKSQLYRNIYTAAAVVRQPTEYYTVARFRVGDSQPGVAAGVLFRGEQTTGAEGF